MAALPGLSGRRSSFLVTSRRLAEKSAVGAGALATSASGPAMRSASDLGGPILRLAETLPKSALMAKPLCKAALPGLALWPGGNAGQ